MSLLIAPFAKAPQFDPAAYAAEPFDPAAYAKEGTFDPVAYMHDQQVQARARDVTPGEAFGAGAAQGATLGFGDEAQGLIQAAGQKVLPERFGGIDYGKTFGQLYNESRDTKRLENEAAHVAHPKTYTTGEVVGGAAPAVLTPGGRLAALATGAAQGAGFSNADTLGGLARDSALGGVVGLAGNEIGSAVSTAGARLASLARGKVANAAARAGTQATEEATGAVNSLQSTYAGTAQTGHRLIENVRRLEASMTPAQRAIFDQLKQSGVVTDLEQQLAGHALTDLPGKAAAIAAKRAEWEAAQQTLPQAIAARTAELSKPQIGADVASLAKSYAEPVIAAAIAPPGMKEAAGLIFGRTRAGKAIAMRVNRPGNQIALWNAVEGAANAPNTTAGEFLKRALAGTATQQIVQAQ